MAEPLAVVFGSNPGNQKGTPEVEVETLVKEKEEQEEQEDTPWRVILYDDDVHTFDEVIEQLIKALGCSVSKAEEFTFKVHNEGKAQIFEGTFEECFRVNGILKEIQLITEIKG